MTIAFPNGSRSFDKDRRGVPFAGPTAWLLINTVATARAIINAEAGANKGQDGSVARASTRKRSNRSFARPKDAAWPQGSVSLTGHSTVVFRRAVARAKRSTLERMHLASTRS